MSIPVFQIDAFASTAFKGNRAAVCILNEPRPVKWMQDVAAEMNLSETAFVEPKGDEYNLRWFTPAVEVNLCGHATLASAHALWSAELHDKDKPCRFHTCSGVLVASRKDQLIELDFPALTTSQVDEPDGLARALGAQPTYVGKCEEDLVAVLENADFVRELKPDFAALETFGGRLVTVTAKSANGEFDFISRCFGPAVGISEDPVTGSAHCGLGPFWAERLSKDRLLAYQASRRGGVVEIDCLGDRVSLRGLAVTVMRGELLA